MKQFAPARSGMLSIVQKTVLLLITTVFFSTAANAKIWYVNDASTVGDVFTSAIGAAGNTGSVSSPFLSITAAITAAATRDSIYVDAGSYTETVTINKNLYIRGAKFGIPAGPAAIPVNRGTNESIVNGSVLFGASRDSITVDGFTVNSGTALRGIEARGFNSVVINNIVRGILNTTAIQQGITARANAPVRKHSYIISNNNVSGYRYGIFFDGNDKTISTNGLGTEPSLISNNYVTGAFSAAISVVNSPGHTIKANLVENNLQGMTFTYSGNQIIENTIRNNNFGNAIRLDGFATNHDNTILNNYIENNAVAINLTVPTGGPFTGTVNNQAHYNYIVGNTTDIVNAHLDNFNATCNWYNSLSPTVIATKITPNVTFIPFLVTGVDTNPLLDGFQPAPLCSLVNCTLTATVIATDVCTGAANGTAAVSVTGATNPTYLWSPGGQTTATVSGLTPGIYTVTVTDGTCTATAFDTVKEITAPVCNISGSDSLCPGNLNVYESPAGMDAYNWNVSSNASVNGSAIGQSVWIQTPETCGQFTVNLMITKNGCTSTCSKIYTVYDTTKPVFVYCPPAIDLGCNPVLLPQPDPLVEATDNCGAVTIRAEKSAILSTGCGLQRTAARNTPDCCIKTQTITYIATDRCGNSAVCTQLFIWKEDTIKPVIIIAEANDLACNPSIATVEATFGNAVVYDNCSANLVPSTVIQPEVALGGCQFTMTKIWTVTDSCGNTATDSQTLQYTRDTTKPVITLTVASTLPCNPSNAEIEAAFGSASVDDNCATGLIASGVVEIPVIVNCTGTVVKNWTVTDQCGNTGTASQTLLFATGTQPPVPDHIPVNYRAACNTSFATLSFDNIVFTDNCSAQTVGADIVVKRETGVGCDSVFTKTWTALNSCGTTGTVSQIITVKYDTLKPQFVFCPAPVDLGCNPVSLPEADTTVDATDNCGSVTISSVKGIVLSIGCGLQRMVAGQNVPACCIKKQVITYTATDECGNVQTCTQEFTWKEDTTKPVIIIEEANDLPCNPGASLIASTFGAATVIDNCSTGLTAIGTIQHEVRIDECNFSTTKTWTVTDDCGNSAEESQTIYYTRDTIRPTILLTPVSTLNCNPTQAQIIAAFGSASVQDNCSQGLVANGTLGDVTGQGCNYSITKTWTVSDACGNSGSVAQTVFYTRDTTKPVITITASGTLPCNPTSTQIAAAFGTATVTDNCSTGLVAIGTIGLPTTTGCRTSVTKTWIVTDACGNTGTAEQTISYSSNAQPPIVTGSYPNYRANCNTAFNNLIWGNVIFTDNCNTNPPPGEGCSLSQGYWFSKPNVVWPDVNGVTYGNETIGNSSYTQTEGIAIWNTSNSGGLADAKKCFTQLSAIKLSGSTISPTASVWSDVAIAENWLSTLPKLTPTNIRNYSNSAARNAAGRIGNWINDHHCNGDNYCSGSSTPSYNPLPTGTPVDPVVTTTRFKGQGCDSVFTRTWTVLNSCGVSTSVQQVITVKYDTVKPVFTFCAPNKYLGCNPVVSYNGGNNCSGGGYSSCTNSSCAATGHVACHQSVSKPVATDNCGTVVISTTYGNVISNGCNRSRTTIYTATDECGNSSTCTQVISWKEDTQKPVMICSPNKNVPCNGTVVFDTPVYYDNCDPNPAIEVIINDYCPNGSSMHTRTWKVTDACGNWSTCSQTVKIIGGGQLQMGTCTHTNINNNNPTGSVAAGPVYNATGTVKYKWYYSNNQLAGTTPVVSGLPAGTYYLTVTDNCSAAYCSQTITRNTGNNNCYSRANPSSGTDNNFSNSTVVSPNPFSDQLVLQTLNDVRGILTADMFTENGEMVRHYVFNVQKGTSTVTLKGLGNLVPGVYLLKLLVVDKVIVQKIIKR